MILEFRIWPTWIMLILLTGTRKSDFRTVNLGLQSVIEGKWLEGTENVRPVGESGWNRELEVPHWTGADSRKPWGE